MKKKLCKVLILGLSLFTVSNVFSSTALADDLTTKSSQTVQLQTSSSYDVNSVDWENIDKITVVYSIGLTEDQFIKDAIDRGIEVVYDINPSIILPRFTYFSSVSWISRDGVMSLSVVPLNPYTVDQNNSWTELVRFFEYHPMYTSISNPSKFMSTKNQYICHADFARGFKTPWNLEPSKADKGYWGFVSDACN